MDWRFCIGFVVSMFGSIRLRFRLDFVVLASVSDASVGGSRDGAYLQIVPIGLVVTPQGPFKDQ